MPDYWNHDWELSRDQYEIDLEYFFLFLANLSFLEQNSAQNQIRLPMSGSVYGIQRDPGGGLGVGWWRNGETET